MNRSIRARWFSLVDNPRFQLYACAALMAAMLCAPVIAYTFF